MSLFRINLIVLVTVLISTAAFAWGLLLPGLDEFRATHNKIDIELKRLEENQRAAGNISDLYASIVRLNEEMSNFRKRLPAERKFGEFLNDLSLCLERAKIEHYNIQPHQAQEVAPDKLPDELELAVNTTVLPVSVSFEGSFTGVFDFLTRLESLERLTHVESLNVVNNENRPGWVKVEIVLHTYHRPDA
ncbi:MAG: type 4a pilus biogenesis protein PilO [Phycisphaerales bacterium]|nr:type 4a pilus biogenesis protein PilO [Phycisphaerales bacterium]